MPLTIRRATVEDARAIAGVHTRSWQWAYRGLVPDDFLDRMFSLQPATLDRRTERHAAFLAGETAEQRTWLIEEDGRMLGFASTMPSRDADATPGTGELGGLYLDPDAAGKGIGQMLCRHAMDDLWRRGYERATLWVLESNARARSFYEREGWEVDGATKTDELPGALLPQVRYRRAAGKSE